MDIINAYEYPFQHFPDMMNALFFIAITQSLEHFQSLKEICKCLFHTPISGDFKNYFQD